MKVVLDTNVLISGLHFEGNENRILVLFYRGMIEVYLSSFILKELEIILEKKFGWEKKQVRILLSKINDIAVIVQPKRKISIIKTNEADNRILECAIEANADYIVTGDRKHLQPLKEFQVVRPFQGRPARLKASHYIFGFPTKTFGNDKEKERRLVNIYLDRILAWW
ncbi:MAG: putative toxin-antitoxin system toxin component, PIN family [Candidatus Omnitrophica bacterium]|nr:putative toxin-antitoxin system toxin component, PIN family [Candidatus Omnitrophota bacterium]